MQALSLADLSQDVVFTLILNAIIGAALAAPEKFGGTAMLLDVASTISRAGSGLAAGEQQNQYTGDVMGSSGYQLITIIVNSGFGDDVMDVARKAGASGGTLMGARGTGTEDDVKFFGITLVSEKDMLLIACEDAKIQAVMRAIGEIPSLSQPGGGIAYTMNLDEFAKLGLK